MSCRICGNARNNYFFSAKNMRSSEKENFDYVQCSACGSVSIRQIPKNLGKHYENYYSFGPVKDVMPYLERTLRRSLFRRTKLARKVFNTSVDLALHAIADGNVHKKDKILDVGCGTGQLVVDLKNLGFTNVAGLDPYLDSDLSYPNGVRIAKKTFFEEDQKWDLIMLHHVFEHMDQQQDILTHASKLLTPSGKLLIRVPNVDSYAYRKYRENWYGIQAPVHLSLPSKAGMEELLAKAGLKIEKVVGENVLEFWAHSEAYALDIWDYDELGIRTYIQNHSLKMNEVPPIFTRRQMREFKCLNKRVQRHPDLCDWVAYYVVKDPACKKQPKRNVPHPGKSRGQLATVG